MIRHCVFELLQRGQKYTQEYNSAHSCVHPITPWFACKGFFFFMCTVYHLLFWPCEGTKLWLSLALILIKRGFGEETVTDLETSATASSHSCPALRWAIRSSEESQQVVPKRSAERRRQTKPLTVPGVNKINIMCKEYMQFSQQSGSKERDEFR